MGRNWRILPHDADRITRLEKMAEIPAVVAQLLVCRGILDPRNARQFLDAKLADLRDPELLPGIDAAADRIHAAIQSRRPITIYGDYDADGMTATAILWRCLSLLGAEVDFYVPNRLDEGYGLNDQALEQLAAKGRQLVVTVDCGITSLTQAATAGRLGLELIVTDHHELADGLPDAAAIVHPGLEDGRYPFRGLCGAGIAFKLAWAICQRASQAKRVQPRLRNFLLDAIGLAAIGTVADVVPLLDENRLIVRHGLHSLKNQPLIGIAALCNVTGLDKKPALHSEDIAFVLCAPAECGRTPRPSGIGDRAHDYRFPRTRRTIGQLCPPTEHRPGQPRTQHLFSGAETSQRGIRHRARPGVSLGGPRLASGRHRDCCRPLGRKVLPSGRDDRLGQAWS